jgi:hypothetical protein
MHNGRTPSTVHAVCVLRPVRKPLWGRTKGLPQRFRRKAGMQLHRSCFLQIPWSSEKGFPKIPPQKRMDQGIDPILSHCQVENATAPLRLCARLSGSGWKSLVRKGDIFSDDLLPMAWTWTWVRPHLFPCCSPLRLRHPFWVCSGVGPARFMTNALKACPVPYSDG